MIVRKHILCFCLFIITSQMFGQELNLTQYTMKDGLSQMKVSDIMFDSRGLLWVGTRNGLNKFDGQDFTNYTTEQGLLHDRIHRIAELGDGRIVILNYKGVNIFDGNKFEAFPHSFSTVMAQLFVDRNDGIWINDTNNSELFFLDLEEKEFRKLDVEANSETQLYYDKQKDIKYLFYKDCYYYLDTVKKQCITNAVNTQGVAFDIKGRPIQKSIKGKSVLYSYFDTVSTFPVLEVGEQINEIDSNEIVIIWNNQVLLPKYGRQFGFLKSQFIGLGSADIDMLNQIWLGTENGLIEVHKPIFKSITNAEVPYVWTVMEDGNEKMWLGTYGDGLYSIDQKDRIKPEQTFIKNFFPSAFRDNKNQSLLCHAGGVLIINDNEEKEYKMKEPVFTGCYDKINECYVFGVLGGFVITKDFETFTRIDSKQGLFENNYIQYVGLDKENNYWLGGYEGLARYNPESMSLTNYFQEADSLKLRGVYCGLLDNHQNMWFGSDNGLLLYDVEADSLRQIESVVMNDLVKSLIQLDEDRILIGTKNSLFVFNTSRFFNSGELDFKEINKTIGYSGIEPGFTGFFRDSKGKIWITSATSLDILEPSELNIDNLSLKTLVSEINGEGIPFDHWNYIYNNGFNNDNLSIQIDAVGSARPSVVKYQYKLDNEPWSEWLERNPIQLNNLSHGIHEIVFRSGPTDLPITEQNIDKLLVRINLPIYKRPFFGPLLLAFILSMLMVLLFYVLKQRREKKQLNKSMEELKYIRNQLLLSELNPHFIFNVLASIQNKILTDKKEEASKHLVSLSKLIRNYLGAAYKGNNPNPHSSDFEISLEKEVEILESYIRFERENSDNHFEYEIEIDQSIDQKNTYLPPMLLQPFVENAIKHGLLLKDESGKLKVFFNSLNSALECRIIDDGVGIAFSKKLNSTKYKTHKSLGSRISVERMNILNNLGYDIEHSISEGLNGGTVVIIKIKDV